MPQDAKKMIFDRIQITEQFFGDLCSEVSSFTKKKARFVHALLYIVLIVSFLFFNKFTFSNDVSLYSDLE